MGGVEVFSIISLGIVVKKVCHFVIASYLKFQKCKVSKEVQSNKINRRASTANIIFAK
jgi:hypothetical protein